MLLYPVMEAFFLMQNWILNSTSKKPACLGLSRILATIAYDVLLYQEEKCECFLSIQS